MTSAVEPSLPSGVDPQAGADRADRIAPSSAGEREVGYEHSSDLARLLGSLNASLLVSTYQAGKLAVIGSHRGQLPLSFHNFDRPMGMAIDSRANTMIDARVIVDMLVVTGDVQAVECDFCTGFHDVDVQVIAYEFAAEIEAGV